ncbi:MAG: DinB family protein [Cyclobacteriaceae bacterium]
MESLLKTWKTNRNLYLKFFENYTPDQLNKIPDGFNNNLIWNIGHIIVAQQSLIYKSADLNGYLPDGMAELYTRGTKPDGQTSATACEELKGLLMSLVDKTVEDVRKGVFTTFHERTTQTGFHLATLEDALHFNNYHEGLHLGYMMSIRKFV